MIEPGVEDVPALVAQAPKDCIPIIAVGDQHAPFASGHLLVRTKRENANIPQTPRLAPFALRTDSFTRILDDHQSITPSHLHDGIHVGCLIVLVPLLPGTWVTHRPGVRRDSML
jgi:hypothetical protein